VGSMSVQPPPAEDDRSVVSQRTVDLAVSMLLLAAAIILGWENWLLGAGWASDGPEAGSFPFYLCILLAAASLVGIVKGLRRDPAVGFVDRSQFRRVLQVAVPSAVYVLGIQFLGIYVSSFLLVAGFMRFLGKSSLVAALVTAAVFVGLMFYVFEVQFTVLLPKGPLERAILY
jgi:putative tricarboxylic transport membrane protein